MPMVPIGPIITMLTGSSAELKLRGLLLAERVNKDSQA